MAEPADIGDAYIGALDAGFREDMTAYDGIEVTLLGSRGSTSRWTRSRNGTARPSSGPRSWRHRVTYLHSFRGIRRTLVLHAQRACVRGGDCGPDTRTRDLATVLDG